MLPPGHIAAGALLGYGVSFLFPNLSPEIRNQLPLLGAFWGFVPDLDEFWIFLKNKNFLVVNNPQRNHRKYFSHAPFLWVYVAVLVFLSFPTENGKIQAMMILGGSWTHFFLDSFDYGIMWLWPFSEKLYSFRTPGREFVITEKKFLRHTGEFLKLYSKTFTFYMEIFILFIALIIYI